MRLSVEVTPEQHQQLKAIAALQGKSLREYVLDRVLPWTEDEHQALKELEALLAPRIEKARREGGQAVTATQIFEDVLKGKQ